MIFDINDLWLPRLDIERSIILWNDVPFINKIKSPSHIAWSLLKRIIICLLRQPISSLANWAYLLHIIWEGLRRYSLRFFISESHLGKRFWSIELDISIFLAILDIYDLLHSSSEVFQTFLGQPQIVFCNDIGVFLVEYHELMIVFFLNWSIYRGFRRKRRLILLRDTTLRIITGTPPSRHLRIKILV